MRTKFMALLQGSPDAFLPVLPDPSMLRIRAASGPWDFGTETIEAAMSFYSPGTRWGERISICLLNDPSANATWFKVPDQEDSYVIGVNQGLIKTLELVAHDVFGESQEGDAEALRFDGGMVERAAPKVASRVGAFLELGFPFGLQKTEEPTARRAALVQALVADALQFAVLHEVSHLVLMHDRGRQHLLRNRLVDLQIATFSIGQEHQADRLAVRLHSSIRRAPTQQFPGMEFAGPALLFGVLGLFERYSRYQAAFDTPHAHPPAYERLYRLRVAMSAGDGHQYWPIPGDEGFRLARQDLPANPQAVAFADSISMRLLAVLERVEAAEGLPSPINTLFNEFGAHSLTESDFEHFCSTVFRWTFLGSPGRVLQHLGEARRAAEEDLQRAPESADRLFLENAIRLVDDFVRRARQVNCYSVERAVRDFDEIVTSRTV
jgi:hypothetical protein